MPEINLADLERDSRLPSTHASEILVVGSDDWAIRDATVRLRAAGRTVHRCSESTDVPFPCNAVVAGVGCPLDRHPVDVVLDIRTRPESQPALSEMGAICGLHGRVPLVLAGLSGSSSFAPFAERVPSDGDIVTTCDKAATEHRLLPQRD